MLTAIFADVLAPYDPIATFVDATMAPPSWQFPLGTDMLGHRLYTTFEPCPMCCGAILASGIATLVMGARHVLGESRWGGYTVEKLIDLAECRGAIEVVTGILTRKCSDIRYA